MLINLYFQKGIKTCSDDRTWDYQYITTNEIVNYFRTDKIRKLEGKKIGANPNCQHFHDCTNIHFRE